MFGCMCMCVTAGSGASIIFIKASSCRVDEHGYSQRRLLHMHHSAFQIYIRNIDNQ